MLAAPASAARLANFGHLRSRRMSGTRTVFSVNTASRHGPCPVSACNASTRFGNSPDGLCEVTSRRCSTTLIEPSSTPGIWATAAVTRSSSSVSVLSSASNDRASSLSIEASCVR